MNDNDIVYRDGRFVLGFANGSPYLTFGGTTYELSCHPFEPCLYIKGPDGSLTAVRNAFDPSSVLETFSEGGTVTSATGRIYDAEAFCRMAAYAAGKGVLTIDEAEALFRGSASGPESGKKTETGPGGKDSPETACPAPEGSGSLLTDDPFFELLARYPDCAVDYFLVRNGQTGHGTEAHRNALYTAFRSFGADEDGEPLWRFAIEQASARKISAETLFAPPEGPDAPQVTDGGSRPYRQAFRFPPTGSVYAETDFRKVNEALFPNGTDALEAYAWTTGWSDYFDEGREWWGTLCLTVYDPSLDRFAVILASATD